MENKGKIKKMKKKPWKTQEKDDTARKTHEKLKNKRKPMETKGKVKNMKENQWKKHRKPMENKEHQ